MTQLEAQLQGLAMGLEQQGEKSAAHICRRVLEEHCALRKTLYELLHVSFEPVGDDVADLQEAHKKWMQHGCQLLGIAPPERT